jgi:hypothetical protein
MAFTASIVPFGPLGGDRPLSTAGLPRAGEAWHGAQRPIAQTTGRHLPQRTEAQRVMTDYDNTKTLSGIPPWPVPHQHQERTSHVETIPTFARGRRQNPAAQRRLVNVNQD